ncbi:glycosyltransferase family 4 protein [Methanolobus sp. WCC1]|uniref:glycosyltransferase family 4 protein n=1 Tax=unclassified Methanolobus TaxID=2629569 RepID=UPI0032475ACF
MVLTRNNKCILSICDISPSKLGSFEEFLISLSKELSINGFKHIIVFRDYPIPSVEKLLLDAGAVIEILKPSKLSILNLCSFYSLIKRTRPELVHFHFYPIYTIVNYLKFFYGIPVIYTDHMGGKKAKNKIKKFLRKPYYYINFLMFDIGIDRIICVSNFVRRKYYVEYGIKSTKLDVIYNGINVEKFSQRNDTDQILAKYGIKDEIVISCIGLRTDKGPHYLAKAIPTILEGIKNLKVIYVGEGECKKPIQSILEQRNIQEKVIFTGNVPDLSEVYSISSIVVVPSIFEEAFCFVAAEAMASGCCVVAFDSGAINEVLYDTSFVVPKNYKLLGNKVAECLKLNNDCRIGKKHVIENFSLDTNINHHLVLYNSLINNV